MVTKILDDLSELFPEEVTIEPANPPDMYGNVTYQAAYTLPAHIMKGVELVRDNTGRERASNLTVMLAGAPVGLSADDRFTLPEYYEPRQPEAITVIVDSDENGPHHATVKF